MSLPNFYRGSGFNDLWIGLSSSEPLGMVDGVFAAQDPFGVGGQVSLLHVLSGVRVPVQVAPWGVGGTDLGGRTPLAPLAAGEYRIEGWMVDLSRNAVALALGFVLVDGPAPANGGVVLGLPGSGVQATLRPAFTVVFPWSGPSSVVFPIVTTSVRF